MGAEPLQEELAHPRKRYDHEENYDRIFGHGLSAIVHGTIIWIFGKCKYHPRFLNPGRRRRQASMFIDEIRISVKAGDGGDGCVSFRRESCAPKGGPDGGDGSRGGSIIMRVNPHLNTLYSLKFKKLYKAEDGKPGSGKQCYGRKGKDLEILVPRGTVVRDAKNGELIVDFVEGVDQWIIQDGGKGGRGNTRFKSSVNQAPRHFEPGVKVAPIELELTLKLIADVGLVGLPNAGKSSLLSRLSHAHPKVAEYPFTTIEPCLGTMSLGEGEQIVFADLPGLIEGASEGRGMGIQFLKHVERTRIILHLVEPGPEDGISPPEAVRVIRRELAKYSSELAAKKEILVLTKMDLRPKEADIKAWEKELGESFVRISAVSGKGMLELIKAVQDTLAEENEG